MRTFAKTVGAYLVVEAIIAIAPVLYVLVVEKIKEYKTDQKAA